MKYSSTFFEHSHSATELPAVKKQRLSWPGKNTLVMTLLLFSFVTSAQITPDNGIVYVDINVTDGDGSGSSWNNATTDLQGAINAPEAQKVFVAIGVYDVPSPSSFVMKDEVAIYGGFDPAQGILTLSDARVLPSSAGVGRGSVLNGKNERPVVWNYNNGLTASAILDGFTLTAGAGTSATSGGAIRNLNVSPTFNNLLIYGNTAANGAAIYNENSPGALTNVAIAGNTATDRGGGIYNIFGNPVLTNVTIVGNTAVNGGGAIYSNADMQLNNAIVYGGISGEYTAKYSLIENNIDTSEDNLNALGILPAHVFVNLSNGNYALVTGSPAIDKGSSTFYTGDGTDLAGRPRVAGSAIDLGAYEYFAATPDANGIVYVTTTGMGGGTSWADATGDIQSAINAGEAQNVWVAKGTYTVSMNSFYMKNGVAVYGGFDPDGGIEDLDDRRILPGADDGPAAGSVLNGRNERSVIWNYASLANPMNATAVLDGFTLTGGAGGGANGNGGGIFNYYASPTLANLAIRNNAASSGGGIYNENSSPLILKCVFFNNTASSSGGGMYNYHHSNPKLVNCLLYGNTGSLFGGGAVYNNNTSSPALINCTLTGNHADNRGGAMYSMAYSHPVFMNCIVYGNTATNDTPGINDEGTVTTTWPKMYYSLIQDRTYEDTDGNVSFSGADTDIFNDPAVSDYTLKAGGPAVNRGRNNLAVEAGITTDLAGHARIQGGRVDLGVYESEACAVPSTLYVNAAITTAGGNGFSWTTAYQYLKDALDMAQQCPGVTEIRVAAGTYYPTGMEGVLSEREAAFTITRSNLTVAGGYDAGTGTRDIAANPTLLSGDVGFPTKDDNSYHIMILAGIPRTDSLIIDGFAFTDAKADGFDFPEINGEYVFQDSGAGIYISNAGNNTVIRNCTFSNNEAVFFGGGMYNSLSDAQITNCTFGNNEAAFFGGGMYNDHSSSVITGCTFDGNAAGGDGGGLLNDGSAVSVSHCAFSNNVAGGNGGGIKNNPFSQLALAYCTFTGNTAAADGGGIHSGNAGLSLINTAIVGNMANRGGGLYNTPFQNPVFINVTLAGNIASEGDAVYIEGGTPQFDNSIIYGGIIGSYTPQNSLIQGYAGGTNGNLNGTVITSSQIFVSPSTGDYTLKNGCPAVNAGNSMLFPGLDANTKDLAGNPRLTGTHIDMGAYENPDGALPVRWISFEGYLNDQRKAVLTWKAEETNVSYYEVERSVNAKDFRIAGEVTAVGTGPGHYRLIDPVLVSGTVYYRIRQVDLDGSFSYSSIISVRAAKGTELRVYPNPAREAVTVELDNWHIGSRVRLVSTAGAVLQEVTVKEWIFSIRLDGYPAGIYLLHTADGKVMKVVKQ